MDLHPERSRPDRRLPLPVAAQPSNSAACRAGGPDRGGGDLRIHSRAAGPGCGGGGVTGVIAAHHLSKWYGQVIGLNDVTLTVPPGITGLLGPNGAGKSTFLKLITGQLKPSKGTVAVLGE